MVSMASPSSPSSSDHNGGSVRSSATTTIALDTEPAAYAGVGRHTRTTRTDTDDPQRARLSREILAVRLAALAALDPARAAR